MSVYVDPSRWPFGRMIMCHMWTDGPIEELLQMVDWIGVHRKWIQGHPELSFGKHKNATWVHFDISKEKRQLAVIFGAIETDEYGPLRMQSLQMMKSDNPDIVARGIRKYAFLCEATRGNPELFKP